MQLSEAATTPFYPTWNYKENSPVRGQLNVALASDLSQSYEQGLWASFLSSHFTSPLVCTTEQMKILIQSN